MIDVGCFSEMRVFNDCGSIKENIIDDISYDKSKVLRYLKSFKHKASCPRNAIDCVTGKVISQSFKVYDDGEFRWCDFLIYHIEHYNIKLPQGLIDKAKADKTAP